jgi:hypothetical protein
MLQIDSIRYIGSDILQPKLIFLDSQARKLFTSLTQQAKTTKYRENEKYWKKNKEKAQKPTKHHQRKVAR